MYKVHNHYTEIGIVGLQRTNVMLDGDNWQALIKLGEDDDRSGSWHLNKAAEAYLAKKKPKAKAKPPAVVQNAIMFMPLNSGEHGITQEDIEKYTQLYPAVNVDNELRAMIGWLDANPAKRKTANGIKNFISSWLKRAQDKGGQGLQSNQLSSAAHQTANNLRDF